MISFIFNFFAHGGFWMWPIFAAQMASIAIVVDRVYALYIQRKIGQGNFIKDIEDDIKRGDLQNAYHKAQRASSDTALGTVAAVGTQAALHMGGREEIQAKMDEVLLAENARLQKRTVYLAMLGNIGTLLGLLGTIVGMIRSFAAISNADPVQRAAILASGISEAMNATAYGLMMAIPTLVLYTILQSRSQKLYEELNQGALKVFNLLSYHHEAIPFRAPKITKK